MSTAGAPPTIPASLQIYNSYVEDPIWQRTFTTIWCSCLGAFILVSLPSLVHALRRRQAFVGFFGVSERTKYASVVGEETTPSPQPPSHSSTSRFKVAAYWDACASVRQWTAPYLRLNVGQIFVLVAYLAVSLLCIIKDAPLIFNPNRAGFLALAQLPVVFLFATKNSLLSFLLGPGHGYEQLNFLHRMAGRIMFLSAVIHGSLWIRNHLQYNIAILGPQKETSGVASLAMLGCIVLFSLPPIRRWFYQVFFLIHVLTYVGFFAIVCYHTPYASPWIFPPLAFYAADLFLRLLRYRFKDATLTAPDNLVTLVRVHDCHDGWIAGQHVCLRVFFSGRILESHPMSIISAPPAHSCLSDPGLLLAARVNGDWTRALNAFVREAHQETIAQDKTCNGNSVAWASSQVMLDGPYGGSSVDLGQYEAVLLVAGGSGATFTLGLLDDIVGRCVKLGRANGERTRRIEFAWYIRSFGNIAWFAPMLMDIATTAAQHAAIDLHIAIFVTCLCNPEDVPPIPNCDVLVERPPITKLFEDLTHPGSRPSSSSWEEPSTEGSTGDKQDHRQSDDMGQIEEARMDERTSTTRGGVAVCACGPASLTAEVQNTVARLGVVRVAELGGVAVHVEQFTL